jgi:hypothetical protein
MFYTETMDSFFHLCRCGCHHNRVDDISMIAGTPEVDSSVLFGLLRLKPVTTVVVGLDYHYKKFTH